MTTIRSILAFLGTHLPLTPAAIIAYAILFTTAFTALYVLHILIFGHRPRFW